MDQVAVPPTATPDRPSNLHVWTVSSFPSPSELGPIHPASIPSVCRKLTHFYWPHLPAILSHVWLSHQCRHVCEPNCLTPSFLPTQNCVPCLWLQSASTL
jgi:hypothetical protein